MVDIPVIEGLLFCPPPPPPPPGNSSLASYFASKILAFKTLLPTLNVKSHTEKGNLDSSVGVEPVTFQISSWNAL